MEDESDQFDFSQYSYVVDAVDTVSAKLEIILQAKKHGVPVISSMGAGNKIAPASVAFVPSVAGLVIASEVVRDLTV